MQIKMDFEQLEDYIQDIDDMVSHLEEYSDDIESSIDSVLDTSSGQFFEQLQEEVEHRKNNIDKVRDYMEDISTKLTSFLEDVKEYDENETVGEYAIDTDEVEAKKKQLEQFVEDIDYLKVDSNFESSINKYEKQKTKFEDSRESDYELEQDYKKHPETADYLKIQKIKIEEQIDNYNYNKNIIEEVDELLKK